MSYGIYLMDWENGLPWGAMVAVSEDHAEALAALEWSTVNGVGYPSDRPIRATRRVGIGEKIPAAYYPTMWRWSKPC